MNEFKSSGDFEEYSDFLKDEFYILDQIKEISNQFVIIGLYRIVELETVKQLKRLYSGNDLKNLFKFGNMIKKLKNDYSIDVKKLTNYKAIDELRLLNNAIKHKNKVTKQLSVYPDWNVGDSLNNLDAAYKRLSGQIALYLSDLTKELIANEKNT